MADFQGIGTERQGNFKGDDFSAFEIAGKCGADAILAEFGGASPTIAEFAALKHAHLEANIDGKAWIAALACRFRGRSGGVEFFAGVCHIRRWSLVVRSWPWPRIVGVRVSACFHGDQLPCNRYPGSKGPLPAILTTATLLLMEYTSTMPTAPGSDATWLTRSSSVATTMMAG